MRLPRQPICHQAEIRQAFMFSGNIGDIARAALEQGTAGLARFGLRLLTPVSPMLANSAEDAAEALDRMGEAAFEFKLDGARIQVHRQGDEVRIFTRQLQDVTDRLPEIVEWTKSSAGWRHPVGRRGHRVAGGWEATSLSGHHAQAGAQQGCGIHPTGAATFLFLFRLPLSRERRPVHRTKLSRAHGDLGQCDSEGISKFREP